MHPLSDVAATPDRLAADLLVLLDETYAQFQAGHIATGMARLCEVLLTHRLATPEPAWRETAGRVCLSHPARAWLHQDPYTLRAFEKPRGYAGDAVMLDFIYRGSPPSGTSPIGQEVFKATTTGLPNGLSVRDRRDRLARMIDELAVAKPSPRVLSLACGHLREGQASKAVQEGRVGEFLALDQDAESLAVVAREQMRCGVTTVQASVTALIRKKVAFKNVDFVYAAGLFDYLADALAVRLLAIMFEMLAPGGKLLVANFKPASHGRGYMEAFMDWYLLYRDECDLEQLTAEIPGDAIADRQTYSDSYGNVAYLELMRGR